MAEPDDKHSSRGRFWGALIGQAVLMLGGASGVSWLVSDTKAEAAEHETEQADAELEARLGEYLNDVLVPEMEDILDRRDDAIYESIDADLDELSEQCRDALVSAETALRLSERSYGTSRIVRERERVEVEEARAAPKPKAVPKIDIRLSPYEVPDDVRQKLAE